MNNQSPSFLDNLKPNTKAVHNYIQEKTKELNSDRIRESLKSISEKLDISTATIQRSIRELQNAGVVGIIPSKVKKESNEIVYFGAPDDTQEVDQILELSSELNSSLQRINRVMEMKDKRLKTLEHEHENLKRQHEILQKQYESQEHIISELKGIVDNDLKELKKSNIVGVSEIDDSTKALIFKSN